ncbi:wyosine [tRNA(Phe)-imidazoG37] synthetase (radical SAM superfamily) [Clostridium tetanomorphum]|uniref:Hydroxymyristoyl-ACP dehydratase n=1 Tax=Clostridium tetanomorphum TaxID=1553 RepID=A0A923ED65_CLOTT|nr:hydroxymyristoyl-ACP dehydratase [Clostridium tetanomorphum]MBC2399907.1 hydroxymyristoyl-ACP dehydratase [Clostridium tetanomorphum]MBP1865980.1 wyosine [tRNA(Phe)-imidazoG37] synthetase (radical SAM superfamily) [Clostridium tetanomorphum]NRS85966.1 wyosine [tRNA(Phe)-imidazoG37] synthetase (radical SAM superfamily) [Clostridium tetanomorphum]NRZ96024.1 wyosine [tRNA(Phe)-imidazoG37] synthetase (radical SAM superfamily) [Clostridium tetanomorphum]SQB89811.1 Uncharacterised protein [Clostr
MMNITCSENCIYCTNGICTLDNISNFVNNANLKHECAYFVKKEPNTKKVSQFF